MWSVLWLFVLESAITVLGNSVTIIVFTTTRRLRSRQYALIVSLAVADLLVGLVSIPMFIVYRADQEARYSESYKLVYYIEDTLLGLASLFGLAALAVERGHATFFPFRHNTLSKLSYVLGIAVVWSLSAIALSPYMVPTGKDTKIQVKIITIAIPLAVISINYLLIFINVRCMATASRHANHQGNRKLTVTLAIVTFVSLITWAPYQFIVLYTTLTKVQIVGYYYYYYTCKFLQYCNSAVNIVIYAFRMRDFRAELVRRMWHSQAGNQVFPNYQVELSYTRRSTTVYTK